jgi:hypothetical protein
MKAPLYVYLKQYRVLAISIILFFAILTWNMWGWFQVNFKELQDNTQAASVFSGLVLLSAGALKWALENVMRKHEEDA